MTLVRVCVPLPVHGSFTYSAPRPLEPGTAVFVPFGRRRINGWVVEPGKPEDLGGAQPKEVAEILDAPPAFDADQLRFYRWAAEYYLAPLGEVVATATPSGARSTTRHVYRATRAGVDALALDPPEGDQLVVLREVVARREATRGTLERRLHGEVADVVGGLRQLMARGFVEADDVRDAGVRDLEGWAVLCGDPAAVALSPRALKAREVLARLAAEREVRTAELDTAAVTRLEKLGVVRREQRPRTVGASDLAPTLPPPLNADQLAVVEAVRGDGTWLLYGVTGAGKTEVYLALATRAVAEGRQVLVLVPEIALTPQLCSRFEARFPGRVAVLHSALSGAERLREWRRIRAGQVAIAVGARSAVFAPFRRLGLVVVDEENDDSYKQDDGVRYHARDLAIVRARMAGCPALLGSATPSLESWENARSGRFQLLRMMERATPRALPAVRVVDMRQEKVDGKEPLVAPMVHDAVRAALDVGGKAILLYNRRGYATFVECPGCGQAYECPSCGVAMVYHQRAARLDCHYCGFHLPFRSDCPKCGSTVAILGRGTERVEEALVAAFPDVPVGRMDADTTAQRGSHARILDDFREGRTRLLVGTQLVAKGHDFPDVHVAAVLGVDHVLGQPDFRSAERTFALVTQLCGRAGRGDVVGQVFLQTHHPEHPVFRHIGDMDGFAGHEDHLRRTLRYPPHARLVLLRCEGADRAATFAAVNQLTRELRGEARAFPGVDVLGPAPAPMARLVGRWRYQVVLRGRELRPFRAFLETTHRAWKTPHGVRLVVDVDPRSLT